MRESLHVRVGELIPLSQVLQAFVEEANGHRLLLRLRHLRSSLVFTIRVVGIPSDGNCLYHAIVKAIELQLDDQIQT